MDERTPIDPEEGRETGTSAVARLSDPTWTPVPGVSSDEWLSALGRSQLKILLYIARHTSGRTREGGERASRVRAASSLSRRAFIVEQGDESPGWARVAVILESLQGAVGEVEPLEPARMCDAGSPQRRFGSARGRTGHTSRPRSATSDSASTRLLRRPHRRTPPARAP